MATIRAHGNKYQVQIRKKGHKPISQSFTRRIDAEAWARKTESEMERGVWHDRAAAEKKSLADVLREYKDYAKTLKDAQISDRIDAIIARWPVCNKVVMARIDQSLFTDYVDMREKSVSGSTINKELGIMSAAINRAIGDGLPADNPIEKINRPKNNKGRKRRLLKADEQDEEGRRLETHEMRSLTSALSKQKGKRSPNKIIKWLVRFAVETAMRRGEILKLEWRHVDLEKKVVNLYDTKNGEDRSVPLSTRARRCLRAAKHKKLCDPTDPRVFQTTPAALKKCFERACERAGLKNLHFHDLRHEATSRLAAIFDMKDLAKITGHKDPRVLIRYYHPRAEELAKKLP